MQDFILGLFNRIRKIKWRELEPWQIGLIAIGAVVGLYLIFRIVQLLFLPVLLLGGIYIAYQFLASRSEEIPEEARKSRRQKVVEEALANVEAAERDEVPTTAEAAEQVTIEKVAQAEEALESENLVVQQIVNPETGFKEPDISRLIEREQEKLKEADKVTEDIMSQLEARKRRLNQSSDE